MLDTPSDEGVKRGRREVSGRDGTYLSDVDGVDALFPIRLPKPDIGVLTGVPAASLDSDIVPAHLDSYPGRGAV
jgi:hypothetical protein